MIYQLISLVGAIVILAAFGAQQLRRLQANTVMYQMLNLVGGFCLAITAVAARQYGFILLEGAWTLASAFGLWRVLHERGAK